MIKSVNSYAKSNNHKINWELSGNSVVIFMWDGMFSFGKQSVV